MASAPDSQPDIVVPEMPSFTKGYHHRPYPAISPSRPEIATAAAGKNIVVTGGGTGIGKAIAIAFAQAGARSVAILGRRADRLQQTAAEMESEAAKHGHSPIIVTEVADLDVLVSNAGMAPKMGTVLGYDAQIMTKTFGLNVLSAFNAINAWVPLAPPGDKAVLINVSSMMAHARPVVTNFAYSMAKAANLKMIDYFAAENPSVFVAPDTSESLFYQPFPLILLQLLPSTFSLHFRL